MRLALLALLLGATLASADVPSSRGRAKEPAVPREAAPSELALRTSYSISSDVLTTEKIWVLDPDEPNPHRQRWILNRKVSLVDLHAREIPGARPGFNFGVAAGGINAVTTAYFRGEGPWYRPMSDFPCSSDPVSWFGTLQGAKIGADSAAKSWDALLSGERIKLTILLRRVTGASPAMALERGQEVFDEWLQNIDSTWRAGGRLQAKRAEWRFYVEEARAENVCTRPVRAAKASRHAPATPAAEDEYIPPTHKGPIPWEVMMEPPATGPAGRAGAVQDETKLLARAPAKLWDGLFSVRLNLTISGRKLNGVFLIDSGVGSSVISPDFLNAQGVLPVWIEVPGAPFHRIPWGGGDNQSSEGGLAPTVMVDLTELGNTPLQLREFALFDTEFFAPPESPSSCCDGVLGTDFLRHYVVELHPGPPAEVKLWPPESFHLAGVDEGGVDRGGSQWFETALSPLGEAVSACTARLELPRGPSTDLRLVGVRWDTGREDALDVHLPWQKQARVAANASPADNSWDISCGPPPGEVVARRVPASFPKPDGAPESAAIRAKVPAFTVGMALLGRGRVFLDFPHGRIWVPDKVSEEPFRRDTSGLLLKYAFVAGKGDTRALYVKSIQPRSPAQALVKRGLRPGMMITQVDHIDAGELDAREVTRHLAGTFGKQVFIQWKTPEGLRLGVMQVK